MHFFVCKQKKSKACDTQIKEWEIGRFFLNVAGHFKKTNHIFIKQKFSSIYEYMYRICVRRELSLQINMRGHFIIEYTYRDNIFATYWFTRIRIFFSVRHMRRPSCGRAYTFCIFAIGFQMCDQTMHDKCIHSREQQARLFLFGDWQKWVRYGRSCATPKIYGARNRHQADVDSTVWFNTNRAQRAQ